MKRERIVVPATLDEAVERLTALDGIVTARQWERAAIVAAHVRLGEGEGGREPSNSGQFLSARGFAELGIVGLRSTSTVTRYVNAWRDENAGNYPARGRAIALPVTEWPPTRTGTDGHSTPEGLTRTLDRMIDEHGPEAVTAAVIDRAVESMPFGGERPIVPGEDVPVNVRTEITHLCADIMSTARVLGVKLREASADDIDATSSALASARAALLDVLDPFLGSADEVEQWLRDEATQ